MLRPDAITGILARIVFAEVVDRGSRRETHGGEMHTIHVDDARDRLADLIGQAARGEDVVIIGPAGAVRLIPISASARPRFGSARELITITEDFDQPLTGLESYEP